MRIALITGIFPPDIGGPATHAALLREALQTRGHGVTVLTASDRPSMGHAAGVVRFPRRWPWPVRALAVAWWLFRHRDGYEVAYATGMPEPSLLGTWLGRRPLVVKVVGDPAWERARRLGLTSLRFDEFQRKGSGLRVWLMRAARNLTLRHATRVIAPSHYLSGVIYQWLGEASDVAVIYNGVQVPHTERRQENVRSEQLRAVFVGRLIPHKQVDAMIGAVAQTPGIGMDIVGDGPERERLEHMVVSEGATDRIQFFGSIKYQDVVKRVAGCDLLLLMSEYEGLPHVAIEALASGTPVVAPDVGGVTEVVTNGENGLILEGATTDELASTLRRLQADAPLRARLSDSARQQAPKWRFERTADEIERLLKDVARGGR